MILQPFEAIFRTMPPPEDGSTFPLSGALDAEILLWQDFEYNPGTLQFMDLLRLLVGERIGVRLPGAAAAPAAARPAAVVLAPKPKAPPARGSVQLELDKRGGRTERR